MNPYLTGVAYQHHNIYIETLVGDERDAMIAHVQSNNDHASGSSLMAHIRTSRNASPTNA